MIGEMKGKNRVSGNNKEWRNQEKDVMMEHCGGGRKRLEAWRQQKATRAVI
jgi:hypothetical protein